MLESIKKLDWRLNLPVLFIIAAGLVSLASSKPLLFHRQLIWIVIGFLAYFLIINFDWRPFVNYRGVVWGIYLFGILLLVITHFLAPSIRGSKSWLPLGPFEFQPSEFIKLALIIVFAGFFSRRHISIARVSNIFTSFFYFLIPAGLIALQPDFGSASVLFLIWLGFLLISGIKWRHLAIAIFIFAMVGIVMWGHFLKNYQKERILGVMFPARDALGINYNAIQAKIAIGSAGLLGKGFGQGTQVQLGFLPEAQTDFIYAAFVEEWGLLAGFLIIAALTLFLFRIVRIGLDSDNNFERFFCLGAAILFLSQFMLNIGSNIGLTPVVGITFPFLSYGGSSILTDLMILAIIQSIEIRRV